MGASIHRQRSTELELAHGAVTRGVSDWEDSAAKQKPQPREAPGFRASSGRGLRFLFPFRRSSFTSEKKSLGKTPASPTINNLHNSKNRWVSLGSVPFASDRGGPPRDFLVHTRVYRDALPKGAAARRCASSLGSPTSTLSVCP